MIGPIGIVEFLLLVAVWGIVPLGFRFLPDSVPLRIARKLQPPAALLATISFFVPKGTAAGALAAPWLAVNGLAALGGLFVLRKSLREGVPSLLLLAAMFFPPVGGVHLVASRLGHPLAGFPEPIVLLTAVHFHYTAFAAPILASLACRTSVLAKVGGAGLVGGTPLLAAGFLFSPQLKIAAVGLLALSAILLAIGQMAASRSIPSTKARILLSLSSLSVIAGMILAAVYEHGFFTGRTWISIPRMAWSHGILNGIGFSLCGLLGWKACNPPSTDDYRGR
jgi:hypothetical protein